MQYPNLMCRPVVLKMFLERCHCVWGDSPVAEVRQIRCVVCTGDIHLFICFFFVQQLRVSDLHGDSDRVRYEIPRDVECRAS
jgi:hypothetical protein